MKNKEEHQNKPYAPNNTTTNTNPNPDSSTQVYQRLHGERTTMTVRILPEIKELFTKRSRQLGLTTCHVLEGLIKGWLYGVAEKTELVHQSPTINLTLVRDVKRVRRFAREFEGEGEVSESGKHLASFYDLGVGGVWKRVEVEHDWDVNVNGHYVECECSVCRVRKKNG
jgi:hypothetical protein